MPTKPPGAGTLTVTPTTAVFGTTPFVLTADGFTYVVNRDDVLSGAT